MVANKYTSSEIAVIRKKREKEDIMNINNKNKNKMKAEE
jgi:hypothetical protein